jgi:hypothetical protein
LQLSLPACTRDKASRQALHKICSPEPANEREILNLIEQNRQKYAPDIKIEIADVFERDCGFVLDQDFMTQYGSLLEQEGLTIDSEGLIIYQDGSRPKEWFILKKIFNTSLFSDEFKYWVLPNTGLGIEELLIISAIIPANEPLYQALIQNIEKARVYVLALADELPAE